MQTKKHFKLLSKSSHQKHQLLSMKKEQAIMGYCQNK